MRLPVPDEYDIELLHTGHVNGIARSRIKPHARSHGLDSIPVANRGHIPPIRRQVEIVVPYSHAMEPKVTVGTQNVIRIVVNQSAALLSHPREGPRINPFSSLNPHQIVSGLSQRGSKLQIHAMHGRMHVRSLHDRAQDSGPWWQYVSRV